LNSIAERFSISQKLHLSNQIYRVQSYIDFLAASKTRFRVHSPFVYNFIEQVLRPKHPDKIVQPVIDLRKSLVRDKRDVIKTDYGASGKETNGYSAPVREIARNSSANEKQIRILYRIADTCKSNNILELGTSLGLSAASLSFGSPKARINTIEGCGNISSLAEENFRILGLDNINIIQSEFDQALDRILKDIGKLDLVFFDGNHRYEPTVRYFTRCLDRIHNDSVFIFDDIHWSRGMSKAWNDIIENPVCSVAIETYQMGYIFFRKELSKQHFILRY